MKYVSVAKNIKKTQKKHKKNKEKSMTKNWTEYKILINKTDQF